MVEFMKRVASHSLLLSFLTTKPEPYFTVPALYTFSTGAKEEGEGEGPLVNQEALQQARDLHESAIHCILVNVDSAWECTRVQGSASIEPPQTF